MQDDLYLRLLFDLNAAHVYQMLKTVARELPDAEDAPTCRDWKRALTAAANELPAKER